VSCPHCGESARFVKYRPKTFTSLVGSIDLERAYYHCSACGQGTFFWDKLLRLSEQRMTPAAHEVVALLATHDTFTEVAERTLLKSAGLRLSESTVQRATESAGEALGQALDAGQVFGPTGEAGEWDWNKDAQGKTCAYVSADATGVLRQGPGGSKIEGRMVNVGMIFNPKPRDRRTDPDDDLKSMPCDDVRYLAGFYTLDELGPLLRRQAGQVGMNKADQWIALTDAGSGLENFMRVNFPLAECILDFQHPVGYLTPLVHALRSSESARKELLTDWCHKLKHEGGQAVLAVLESLPKEKTNVSRDSDNYQEALAAALTYFRNHAGRMKYPEYLQKGWQIGTGAVESACKTVVNRRLCMGGMRWGDFGGDQLSHLRALSRSDLNQWDGFWATFKLAA
jgi:hypothetical protein